MSPQFLQVLMLLRRGLGGDRAETGRHLSGDPLPALLGPTVLWSMRGLAGSVQLQRVCTESGRGVAWQPLPLPASALSSKPVALSCARLFQLLLGMLPLLAPCSTHGLAFPVPGLINRSWN